MTEKHRVPTDIYKLCVKWLPRANAGVALVDTRSKILLFFRDKGVTKGQWELVGGGVDKGEKVEEAARRELEEEADIKVTKLERFKDVGTVTAFHSDRTDVVTTFLVRITEEEKKSVKLPRDKAKREHSRYNWRTLDDWLLLQDAMHQATREQLIKVREYLGKEKVKK